MSNTLGILEYTLAQVATSTAEPNLVKGTAVRKEWFQPRVIRISDHEDNVTAETTDPYKMALFCSKAHGHPWEKQVNCQKHLIHSPTAGLTPAASMNIIFPNFDYTTFE
jgi:hypothetical protein